VPVFEQRLAVMIRNVRAFLLLQAGVTRSEIALPWRPQADQDEELKEARRELEDKEQEIRELRARLVRSATVIEAGGLKPENVVWIFGTGRSGNTWLTAMMESAGHAVWKEPAIGRLFGDFYYDSRDSQRRNAKFVLGDPRKDVWLGSIRRFVLEGASGRFPELSGPEDYLVVKEQVGSMGAPLLSEALPESRVILLVRDPRDVVSSWLDGSRSGGWHQANMARKNPKRTAWTEEDPDRYVKGLATHYAKNVGKAAEAYSAHEGPKVLVRYEELRADTLGTMKRIHSTLGMKVDEESLVRAVEEHSWENIPEEEKGEGKFRRKATPGSWREDLTAEQVRIVEEETRPLLEEFYSNEAQGEKLSEKSPLG
jgi:sulfotransferase family protein